MCPSNLQSHAHFFATAGGMSASIAENKQVEELMEFLTNTLEGTQFVEPRPPSILETALPANFLDRWRHFWGCGREPFYGRKTVRKCLAVCT
jgi:hypothetical protein